MSGITIDPLYAHSFDIGEPVGEFHGTPIVSWDPNDTLRRETIERRKRIAASKLSRDGGDDV